MKEKKKKKKINERNEIEMNFQLPYLLKIVEAQLLRGWNTQVKCRKDRVEIPLQEMHRNMQWQTSSDAMHRSNTREG